MAATELLTLRLEPGEKERVARAAHRAGSANVSDYVRQRLFGRKPSDADQALLQMLAEIKPRVTQAVEAIDVNLAEIRRLRESQLRRDDDAVLERAKREFNATELAAIAERLQLEPPAPGRMPRVGQRRSGHK